MKQTRRTKITIEKERRLVIAQGRRQARGRCEACRAEVRMIGTEEAALVAGRTEREVFRLIESGRLHFTETARGALLICLDSLLAEMREP